MKCLEQMRGASRWQRRRARPLARVGSGAHRVLTALCFVPDRPDPKAAPTDVRIRVLNSTAIALTWTRVHLDTIQGQLKEYRVSKSKSLRRGLLTRLTCSPAQVAPLVEPSAVGMTENFSLATLTLFGVQSRG